MCPGQELNHDLLVPRSTLNRCALAGQAPCLESLKCLLHSALMCDTVKSLIWGPSPPQSVMAPPPPGCRSPPWHIHLSGAPATSRPQGPGPGDQSALLSSGLRGASQTLVPGHTCGPVPPGSTEQTSPEDLGSPHLIIGEATRTRKRTISSQRVTPGAF